ncbi:MAG TPA: Crp/Fnr family transcriptional regulator [Myxococcota bacterium]|nr:Crp/Fnr family transcriptional regulator [Myxococcota bacterium]
MDASEGRGRDDTGYVVRQSYEREYAPGEAVYQVGDERPVLYVLQSGQVELVREGPDGPNIVARHGPGDFFGEMGVLGKRPRSTRAVAVTSARVLELDRETFEAMCIERPEIAIRVIRRLAGRLTDLERRLAALGADDLLRPVVRVLMRRGEALSAGGARFAGNLRQLAADAGLSMLEAHRALGQLLERKRVRLQEDGLVIPDLDALAAALDDA